MLRLASTCIKFCPPASARRVLRRLKETSWMSSSTTPATSRRSAVTTSCKTIAQLRAAERREQEGTRCRVQPRHIGLIKLGVPSRHVDK